MNISIIGTGSLAYGLGRRWVAQGNPVVYGAQDTARAAALAGGIGYMAGGGSIMQAAQFGSVIILAVPFHQVEEVLRRAGPMNGKVLVDCSIPLNADLSPINGLQQSAAEYLASMVPGARVVKAFHHIHADSLWQPIPARELRPHAAYCGDSITAKTQVELLIEWAGFIPEDMGGLAAARLMERRASQRFLFGRTLTLEHDFPLKGLASGQAASEQAANRQA